MTYTLEELADLVNAKLKGDAAVRIASISTLEAGKDGDISFYTNPRYKKYLATTTASAVILSQDNADLCMTNALIVNNPYLAYAKISSLLNPVRQYAGFVHESAVIGDDCSIAKSAYIDANVTIGDGVKIGEHSVIKANSVIADGCVIGSNTLLYANVTIYHDSHLGDDCIVHSGVVIGSDGFGIANDDGKWFKVPQIGRAIIGNHVEIGANTTIDRGAISDTVIKDGVKLDNQIQIAHNVLIGENTAIAGCVGIAGSVTIGARCAIGGGVGITGHIVITDDVQITAMSLVTRSIDEPGIYSSGTPLQPNRDWHRNFIRFAQLEDMARRLKQLEKKLQQD